MPGLNTHVCKAHRVAEPFGHITCEKCVDDNAASDGSNVHFYLRDVTVQ